MIEIREAKSKDADSLYKLNQRFGNDSTKAHILASLKENQNEIVCLAFDERTAIGYCTGFVVRSICYGKIRLDVESLYVEEAFRRQGVGRQLIRFIEETAMKMGIQHFHINAEAVNQGAVIFYRKLGYEDAGEILLEKTIK